MYQSFFKQSYTYKNEDYAPENYLLKKYSGNSKYSSLAKKSEGNSIQGSAYMIGKPENDETITKMIFDGTAEENNYVKSYWLASPRVGFNSGLAYFGPGAVIGGSDFQWRPRLVCFFWPMVCPCVCCAPRSFSRI